jgi:hypothetical protein
VIYLGVKRYVTEFSIVSGAFLAINATLYVSSVAKGCDAVKNFSLTGHPWLPVWYLEMKLQRRRLSDPALSWADRCEGPSMR